MVVTAKDLRFNISELFDVINKGEDVLITYRGVPKAKLSSIENNNIEKDNTLFGIWKDKEESVDDYLRNIRAGRKFDL